MHPLLAAIKDDPKETARWLVWADWLDENDRQAEAAGWRWMAREGQYPLADGWYWHDENRWRSSPERLPKDLFDDIYRRSDRNYFESDPFLNLCWLAESLARLGVPE